MALNVASAVFMGVHRAGTVVAVQSNHIALIYAGAPDLANRMELVDVRDAPAGGGAVLPAGAFEFVPNGALAAGDLRIKAAVAATHFGATVYARFQKRPAGGGAPVPGSEEELPLHLAGCRPSTCSSSRTVSLSCPPPRARLADIDDLGARAQQQQWGDVQHRLERLLRGRHPVGGSWDADGVRLDLVVTTMFGADSFTHDFVGVGDDGATPDTAAEPSVSTREVDKTGYNYFRGHQSGSASVALAFPSPGGDTTARLYPTSRASPRRSPFP